jgi:hypothetical protein
MMMPDLFQGPKLKIERAERHIADYRVAFKTFAEANRREGIPQTDPNTGEPGVLFPSIGPLPVIDQMRLIAADALYNLRCALDQAVCRTVPAGKSPKGTYFPHGQDEEGFKISLGEKCKKVPHPVRKAIANLEPYYGGDGALLRVLHDLNLIDKHTDLLQIEGAVAKIEGTVRERPGPAPGHGSEGIDKVDLPTSHKHQHVEITALVTFCQVKAVKGESVTQVLFQLRDLVRKTVSVIERAAT